MVKVCLNISGKVDPVSMKFRIKVVKSALDDGTDLELHARAVCLVFTFGIHFRSISRLI